MATTKPLGDKVRVKVFVGNRLATTFWSFNDEYTQGKVPDLRDRFTKRKRESIFEFVRGEPRNRIVEIRFRYTGEPKKTTALVPYKSLNTYRRMPVCPVART